MRITPARLGWRSVRHRPGSFVGATVALFICTALIAALAFIHYSGTRQEPTVERFAGVPVVVVPDVQGGHGVSSEAAEEVADLPEVAGTVGEMSFPAAVVIGEETVRVPGTEHSFGHGWGSAPLTPFTVVEGDPPAAGEVVLDRATAEAAELGVGDKAEVLVLGLVREYRVSGVAETGADWRYQSALFFPDDHAAELSGRMDGHTDALGVFPSRGVDAQRVRAAVAEAVPGSHVVLAGVDRGRAEGNVDPEHDRSVAAGLRDLMLLVAVVGTGVVAGAVGLAVRSRWREVAVLRAVAADPGQVRRMIAGETAVISAVALLVGLPVGTVLAGWLLNGPFGRDRGISEAFQLHHPPEAVLLTTAVVVVSAQAAGVIATRSALRIRPSDAFAEAVTEGRPPGRLRVVVGCALLLGTACGAFVLAGVPIVGGRGDLLTLVLVVSAFMGAGLVGPGVLGATATALRRAGRGFWPWRPGLAVANTAFLVRRFAGAAGALLLGVTLVGVFLGAQSYQDRLAGERATALFSSDLLVRSGDRNLYDARAREAVETIPGVSGTLASHAVRGSLSVGEEATEEASVLVLEGDTSVVDLGVVVGDVPSGGGVAVNRYVAEAHGVSVGDTVGVTGAGGPEPMRVTGLFGGGFLDTVLAVDTGGAELLGLAPGRYDEIHLVVDPGAPPDEVRAGVMAALPMSGVYDRAGSERLAVAQWAEQNSFGTSVVLLVGALLGLGVVNTLTVTQLDRGGEFSAVRLLGMGRLRIHAMVAAEISLTVLVLFTAAVLVVLCVAGALALGHGDAGLFREFFPARPLLGLGGVVLVLSMSGALLAVHSVLRNEERQD